MDPSASRLLKGVYRHKEMGRNLPLKRTWGAEMGLRFYLPLAVVFFGLATLGSDVFARMSIAHEPFDQALREHLYWARVQFIGTGFLLTPFVAVAAVCALAEKRARSPGIVSLYGLAMVALLYFYFEGYQGSQQALAEGRYMASALSIGLLPFFIGLPIIPVVLGVAAVVAKCDPRSSEERQT